MHLPQDSSLLECSKKRETSSSYCDNLKTHSVPICYMRPLKSDRQLSFIILPSGLRPLDLKHISLCRQEDRPHA